MLAVTVQLSTHYQPMKEKIYRYIMMSVHTGKKQTLQVWSLNQGWVRVNLNVSKVEVGAWGSSGKNVIKSCHKGACVHKAERARDCEWMYEGTQYFFALCMVGVVTKQAYSFLPRHKDTWSSLCLQTSCRWLLNMTWCTFLSAYF